MRCDFPVLSGARRGIADAHELRVGNSVCRFARGPRRLFASGPGAIESRSGSSGTCGSMVLGCGDAAGSAPGWRFVRISVGGGGVAQPQRFWAV